MRIIQACVRYPPAPGGAETHVREISERLAARGHDVVVHTTDLVKEVPFTRRRDGWPSSDRDGPVRVFRHAAWTPGREIHYTFSPGLFRGVVRDARGADVVHAHSYGYFQTLAAAVARHALRAPFVLTPHFHPPWSMEGGSKRRALRAVYDRTVSQYVMRRADRIVGVSSGELAVLAETVGYDASKTVIVPNGISLERFTPPPDGSAFRKAFGLGDAPLVLFAGRLAVNKGLHHLVRAFARVAVANAGARLALAGEDQDQGDRLRAIVAELGLGDRVAFTGHLTEESYRSALGAADVFALPSEWEAFGIVLAEAMACGKPCVATRVGGAPDVVRDGETGYLVPYGDEVALADRISSLLADPARRDAFGRAGRARVASEFTWDAVVDALERVYAEAARGRGAA